ncbi:MAG: hypothetical protein M0R35_07740 [Candidatus Omnitrophica bacterium]|nr:hypothetical protein [Candidatus Omnitrophota bacterium]
MKTFAFLIHPLNTDQILTYWPLTRFLPASLRKTFLKHQNFKVLPLKKIISSQNKEIQGYLIVCPLLPDEILELDDEIILGKIIDAGFIAERIGAEIMGIGGYMAITADKKPMIHKHLKVPITSGSAFTAWSVFETIFRTAKQRKINLKDKTIAIVGPMNAVGSLCAQKFSEHSGKVLLTGEWKEKLQRFKKILNQLNLANTEIEADIRKAVSSADIVINTHTDNTDIFSINDLKPKSIVYDASIFQNISRQAKLRKDIFLIESNTIKLPFAEHTGFDILPDNNVYAAMAETILLALEDKFVTYSLGESRNSDKLEEIANIAVRHGFEINLS